MARIILKNPNANYKDLGGGLVFYKRYGKLFVRTKPDPDRKRTKINDLPPDPANSVF